MDNVKHSLENNARILKTKVTKYALVGLLISIVTIIVATFAVAYQMTREISLASVILAQRSNVALIILDLTPILFMFWGQSVSSVMSYTAGAMVVDQTNALRMQTNEIESRAQHESSHDLLTDLPNRVLFVDRLTQALTALRGRVGKLAVIIVNINNFKELNSGFGSYNADRFLKQFAQRLRCIADDPVTIARIGGDEFAILHPYVKDDIDVFSLIKKLQKALSVHFVLDSVTLDISASMGITFYPEHGRDEDTLIQRANIAVYHAKQINKDCVVYDSFMDKACPNKLILMNELKRAVEGEQLLVYFQPKVELATGKITSCEALLRWSHPSFGIMNAEKFIPIAERTGLIKSVSQYVLKQAIEQASQWRKKGVDIEVSVNLSAIDIIDIELPYTIESMLNIYDFPANLLKVELIESYYLSDQNRAVEVITRLATLGVKVAIDDFGTGYSSFVYLTALPINEVKIDKSFIVSLNEDHKKRNIVYAIIKLASALNLNVVAEGIESAMHLNVLKSLGCQYGQGFYFSEAIHADALLKMVIANATLPETTSKIQASSSNIHVLPN